MDLLGDASRKCLVTEPLDSIEHTLSKKVKFDMQADWISDSQNEHHDTHNTSTMGTLDSQTPGKHQQPGGPSPDLVRAIFDQEGPVLDLILVHSLPKYHETIYPDYAQWMVKDRSHTDITDRDLISQENIDLGVLLVNRAFSLRGSEIFYGNNLFCFEKALVCEWWMKRIGQANLIKIRHLKLFLCSGFLYAPYPDCDWSACEEENWLAVTGLLLRHHDLRQLHLVFADWLAVEKFQMQTTLKIEEYLDLFGITPPLPADVLRPLHERYFVLHQPYRHTVPYTPAMRARLTYCRRRLWHALTRLRGIPRVTMECDGVECFPPTILARAALLIQQQKLSCDRM